MSRRRATPTPLLNDILKLKEFPQPIPLAALLAIPDKPATKHKVEAIVREFCNFCTILVAFPLSLSWLADYLQQSASTGTTIEDLRLQAQILIGVDELWRRLPTYKRSPRPCIARDDFSDLSILLDDHECKLVYDALGVALFDAHQTWGEIALNYRRSRTAYLKDGSS